MSDLPRLQITFEDFGMGYNHNMPCAVYHSDDTAEPAILNCNKGVFEPSGKAQSEGWHLVHAQTRFQKFLIRNFFNRFK